MKLILDLSMIVDVKGETIKALVFREYASHCGYTVDELLQHEITSRALLHALSCVKMTEST